MSAKIKVPKQLKKRNLGVGDYLSDEEQDFSDTNRRGSNVSLSRVRSCPQLLEEYDGRQIEQSFENIVDDNISAPGIQDCRSPRSPMVAQGFQFQSTCLTPGSATPTPPSSPESQRSSLSQRGIPDTPVQNNSPITTPKIRRGSYSWRANISQGSSVESLDNDRNIPNVKNNIKTALNSENLQKHERLSMTAQHNLNTSDNKCYDTLQPGLVCDKNIRPKSTSPQSQGEGELQSKCEMWLQTLNISQGDKIKSRSHIQLPPI
ncbi:uncharacterized protein LOC125658606 [Ostrea edulis]|uniref:uncharacterized protein LOC125658606 n=1 Tax=Ostrea edulis TaxID=37623 RepID=UPI0020953199|nr:uncharacterized protein LOC125658606 [Ostrea edulis]XP_048745867.1 uncharacterized protein LOC125658606 [Ostrea edulis]XP_048745868.1 uncharacterized protein LOC125658606 [Ostrea edulis]XP_048745869.1 uncharacterized protein LOC125658606 [Ostrea edulis]XP_048745870.1 uncharacterized protein LOC125658606 [Ostrea edulis]